MIIVDRAKYSVFVYDKDELRILSSGLRYKYRRAHNTINWLISMALSHKWLDKSDDSYHAFIERVVDQELKGALCNIREFMICSEIQGLTAMQMKVDMLYTDKHLSHTVAMSTIDIWETHEQQAKTLTNILINEGWFTRDESSQSVAQSM